jgi:hypothetical protein
MVCYLTFYATATFAPSTLPTQFQARVSGRSGPDERGVRSGYQQRQCERERKGHAVYPEDRLQGPDRRPLDGSWGWLRRTPGAPLRRCRGLWVRYLGDAALGPERCECLLQGLRRTPVVRVRSNEGGSKLGDASTTVF